MTFQEMAARMISLYREREYGAALAVVREARPDHPEEDSTITFWEGCLLSRVGRKQEALRTLQAGIERGHWWPTGKLVDHDLDAIRDEPGWRPIRDHCVAMTQSLLADRPQPMVRHGSGAGTVVTIQGAHAVQEDFFNIWDRATPSRWTVITPVASEPNGEGLWEWPHSLEASTQNLMGDLDQIDLDEPLVLSGFSVGAAIGSEVVNSTEVAIAALIAIAPWSPADFEELVEATSTVPSLVICGDQDSRVDGYRRLGSRLGELAGSTFELVSGLGHANPSDLAVRVGEFQALLI